MPDTLPGMRVETLVGQYLSACENAVARVDPPLTDGQRDRLLNELQTAGRELLAELANTG